MKAGADVQTSLKELDSAWNARKGTAFRAFKHALPGLVEDQDFVYLNAQHDQAKIERLRSAQRIYASSINVVMLTANGVGKLVRP